MNIYGLKRTKSFPAVAGGESAVVKARVLLPVMLLLVTVCPTALSAHDLVAVTASGRSFVLVEVEKDVVSLEISSRNRGVTLDDPIVDITGFAGLENLVDLRFHLVPQIASFDFLRDCVFLKKLVISFARVTSMEFLSSMPEIELVHLEFCDDWESGYGLSFLKDPLDLQTNQRLKYLAFRICDLVRVPRLIHVPETLECVDISYNGIEINAGDVTALETLRNVDRVFVNGNSATASILADYGNLVSENADSVLAEYLAE